MGKKNKKERKKKAGGKASVSVSRRLQGRGAASLGHMFAEAKAQKLAGKLFEAEQSFKAVLRINPSHCPSLVELAAMAIEAACLPIALDYAKKAVASDHADPQAHVVLANVLANLGLTDLAESELIVAQQLDQQNGQIWNGLGLVLIQQGRFDEAVDAFHRAIELSPEVITTYYNLASAKRFTPDDPDIERIKDLCRVEAAVNMDDKAMIHFALAKAYHDCDEYDQAFAEYRQGNDIKRQIAGYDPEALEVFAEQLIKVQSKDWVRRLQGSGSLKEGSLFVVGMPRSGTTLLEKLLCRHSQVSGLGEPPYISNLARSCEKRLDGEFNFPQALEGLSPAMCQAMGDEYVSLAHQFSVRTKYTVDKTPENFFYLGFILSILPNAKILHNFRHPVDTCLSIYQQLFRGVVYSYDLEQIGRYYLSYRRMMEHWKKLFPDRILDVNYEDVVADTETELRSIMSFCGLPWEEACLDDGQLHKTRTASVWQARQPIYQTSVRRWRHYEKHLGPLLEILAPLLEEESWREKV